MPFVVKKDVADKAHKIGCNVREEFYGALAGKVEGIIEGAAKRAKANGRKTLMRQDL